jgi:hypothetical protein
VLRDQVREAKHALSFHGSAPIGVRSGGQEWVCTVTREEFEHLIEPQLRRAVELVQQVVQDAVPSVQQLHRVYLTGGSSHIPALQAKLNEILPMKLGLMGDPKQVTSIGALEAPLSRGRIVGTGNGRKGAPVPKKAVPKKAVPKKALIGGGVAASVALLVAAVMLGSGGTPLPTRQSSSAGRTEASTRMCGGRERPDLREGECNLLTSADSIGRVAPDSCVANSDLGGASYGLVCEPNANSDFSSTERPTVYVYGYSSAQSMTAAFEEDIRRFNATEGSAAKPPGWETWHLTDDKAQTSQGRVLSASEEGVNYLIWTEDESHMMIQAESKDAEVRKLYAWWHK